MLIDSSAKQVELCQLFIWRMTSWKKTFLFQVTIEIIELIGIESFLIQYDGMGTIISMVTIFSDQ